MWTDGSAAQFVVEQLSHMAARRAKGICAMGVNFINAILYADCTPPEKLVGLTIASSYNEEPHDVWKKRGHPHRCFIGTEGIMEITRHSRRTVISAIASLERKGIIRITRRPGRSSFYDPPVRPFPRTKCTRAGVAPVQEMHSTGATDAPPPVQEVHGGGAGDAPESVSNQNVETVSKQNLFPAPLAADDGGGQKSSSSKPSRSKKAKSEADPRHHEITSKWGEPYRTFHGQSYVFSGKDASALKRFLASARDVTAAQFMERAGKAWTHAKADRFARQCARAATIAGLCDAWNDIVTEMQRPAAGTGAMHDRRPKNRRDERGQLPGEIPTDVTADKIPRIG